MNKRLVLLFLCYFCSVLQASKTWDVGDDITGGSIDKPVSNGVYLCGAKVDFECTRATDEDHWCDPDSTPNEGTEADTMSTDYPKWTATAGSWKDGDYRGTSVDWIAPNSANASITVKMYENDLPESIPWFSGTRNDSEKLIATRTIEAVLPDLNTVDYGGGNHAISGVTPPEYDATAGRNEPACWTKETTAQASVTFKYDSLSQSATNMKVKGDAIGDNWNIWDWLEQATGSDWPATGTSPAQNCVANGDINDHVDWEDYDNQWQYKCTDGSNSWINSTRQEDCRLYVVLDTPISPESTPNETILEYATKWAHGNTTKESACNSIVGAFGSHYTWNYNCHELASDFVRLVATLGISSSENRWAARGSYYYSSDIITVGDMVAQRTRTIDPVGTTHGSSTFDFGFHEWSQAESNQYDPTTTYNLNASTWGDYEDWLFTFYGEVTSISPFTYSWVADQTGQSSGCEATGHYENDPAEVLQSWSGP